MDPLLKALEETLVGVTLDLAFEECIKNDMKLRVVVFDGKPLIITRDYNAKRINVCVKDNLISEVRGIG